MINRDSIQWLLEVDKKEIAYIVSVFEGYDNLAIVRTVNPAHSIIELIISPDYLEDTKRLINALSKQVYIRKIKGKYVCIAVQSTAQCKYWNLKGGWDAIVKYLRKKGYKVVCIDKHKQFGIKSHWNFSPKGVIDKTGDFPIEDRKVPHDTCAVSPLVLKLHRILTSENSSTLYVHCRGGHGRSGIVVACILCYLNRREGWRACDFFKKIQLEN